MATIRIPTPLRPYVDGQSKLELAGESVGGVLDALTDSYPKMRDHLYDGDKLRSFVNIYVNSEDIRSLDGTDTAVEEGDTLMIVPSIAGGR